MISAVPDILARIVEHKKAELANTGVSLDELESQAEAQLSTRRDFVGALKAGNPAIISEIKKASPSKGILSDHFDPPAIAVEYQAGGAAALSVLTDSRFFQGSMQDLQSARKAVRIPVLRKDFTIDPYHVAEAAAAGADAILLIAAILTEREMRDLRELAARFHLATLVEVHNLDELTSALGAGSGIIGVNNRDLRTFEVRLETSLQLAEHIPDGIIRVSESGIHSREDVQTLSKAGYSAFLVGEHLMRSGNPRQAVRELFG